MAKLVLPRTPVERTLATIWAQTLKLPQVGVTEDFFAIGGHSLLVTQIVSRVAAELKVDLPIRALFEAPTIARLERIARR